MSGRGGRRPGAGKPKGYKHKGTLLKAEARARFTTRVLAELDPLITAQLELAKGCIVMFGRLKNEWVQVTDPAIMLKCLKSGAACYRIVSQPPDGRALKDIFDREFGRPVESVQHVGEGSGPIHIIHELHQEKKAPV